MRHEPGRAAGRPGGTRGPGVPSTTYGYISRHQLPVNPVYTKLQRLGAPEHFLRVSAMLDGNRLEEGRVTWLRRGWPALFEELAVVLPRIREYV